MAKQSQTEIWVYGDLRNERFFGFSLNVLAKAKELARSISGRVTTVLMSSCVEPMPVDDEEMLACIAVDTAEKQCLTHGADQVYCLEDDQLSVPRADTHAAALSKIVQTRRPKWVLFALTEFGREVAARSAMINRSGLIADCVDLSIKNNELVANCPSWGGEVMAEIAFSDPAQTGFLTLAPHAFQAVQFDENGGTVEHIPIGPIETPAGVKLLSRALEPEKHRKLEDAKVVVVGGAGLGSAEGFSFARNLAASLGGEIAATRPAVLKHWVDGERLIGQTGKTVRPDLLFSIGTSGAVQYTAGIMESNTIVAVNRDSRSPIFDLADFGIVADAKTFLPILTDKINQAVMRNLADDFFEKEGAPTHSDFGAKLRKLRESKKWTLENLSEATGQSPEFITQVEKDEISPSVSFLLRIAGALKVDPGTFLRKEEKTKIRDMRAQAMVKRTQNYSYQTLTDSAETDHLHGFMITIEARQTHKPVAYKHDGEEFIFVLEGDLELTVGNRIHNLKPGESIHFHSETPHKLKNLSHETTRCLVVLFTP